MTEDRRTKMMDIIRKLMMKAMDNGVTKAEAMAFKEKAANLMAKYQISMSETTMKEDVVEDGVDRFDLETIGSGRTTWPLGLAATLAEIFECQVVRTVGSQDLTFLGFPDDLETVIYFFNYLQIEISQRCRRQNLSTIKESNSYGRGMVHRIELRMKEVYKRVKEIVPSDCRDLIVLKKDAVDKKMETTFSNLRTSKSSAKVDNDAFYQGYHDGGQIDIGNHAKSKIDD